MDVSSLSNQKTIQQIIDSTSSNSSKRNTGELGKDDFLNLLVTQLQYQDPLEPMDDKEFIGQMAQFSSLEQMQNMGSSLTQAQAYSLIGKHVKASVQDEATGEVKVVEGSVTAVKVDSGKAYVVVNDQNISVDKVTEVTDGNEANNSSNLALYTNLFGCNAKGGVYDPSTGEIVGVEGVVKSVQKGLYEDYAVMDGVNAQIYGISGQQSTDPESRVNYLEDHVNSGEFASLVIENDSGNKVTVSAKVRSYTVKNNGDITAVLDSLQVPVDSIVSVSPAQQDSGN